MTSGVRYVEYAKGSSHGSLLAGSLALTTFLPFLLCKHFLFILLHLPEAPCGAVTSCSQVHWEYAAQHIWLEHGDEDSSRDGELPSVFTVSLDSSASFVQPWWLTQWKQQQKTQQTCFLKGYIRHCNLKQNYCVLSLPRYTTADACLLGEAGWYLHTRRTRQQAVLPVFTFVCLSVFLMLCFSQNINCSEKLPVAGFVVFVL